MKNESERVLLVDDDRALLDGLRRSLRKCFPLETALGGEEGLAFVANQGPFAVVVSDYRMPGMNGIQFLSEVRRASPDTIRVMLTGNAELQSAIDAINEGQIFRFVTKPCKPEALSRCLEDSIEQYRLRQAERVLLEQTLRGSVAVLADVLALSNPEAFGRSMRIRGYVNHVVTKLDLPEAWKYETAALLSQIGLVAIPTSIVEAAACGSALSSNQQRILDRHPRIAEELLAKIPRLEEIAGMIGRQGRGAEESGPGAGKASDRVKIGAEILTLAVELDELVTRGRSTQEAVEAIVRRGVGGSNEQILAILSRLDAAGRVQVEREVVIEELTTEMTLNQDVTTHNGTLLVKGGNQITASMLARLKGYAELGRIAEPICVLAWAVEEGDTKGQAA